MMFSPEIVYFRGEVKM